MFKNQINLYHEFHLFLLIKMQYNNFILLKIKKLNIKKIKIQYNFRFFQYFTLFIYLFIYFITKNKRNKLIICKKGLSKVIFFS